MRLHIEIEDALVAEVDRVAGPRRRSEFVRAAVIDAMERRRRWELIRSARGAVDDEGHEWDADPAEWVAAQRHGDARFTG